MTDPITRPAKPVRYHRKTTSCRIVFSCQLVLLLLVGSFTACNHASTEIDPAVLAEQRANLLLTEEPDGVLPVLMAREMLENSGDQIVVLGRVGGVDKPWQEGRATFMMVDPTLSRTQS